MSDNILWELIKKCLISPVDGGYCYKSKNRTVLVT